MGVTFGVKFAGKELKAAQEEVKKIRPDRVKEPVFVLKFESVDKVDQNKADQFKEALGIDDFDPDDADDMVDLKLVGMDNYFCVGQKLINPIPFLNLDPEVFVKGSKSIGLSGFLKLATTVEDLKKQIPFFEHLFKGISFKLESKFYEETIDNMIKGLKVNEHTKENPALTLLGPLILSLLKKMDIDIDLPFAEAAREVVKDMIKFKDENGEDDPTLNMSLKEFLEASLLTYVDNYKEDIDDIEYTKSLMTLYKDNLTGKVSAYYLTDNLYYANFDFGNLPELCSYLLEVIEGVQKDLAHYLEEDSGKKPAKEVVQNIEAKPAKPAYTGKYVYESDSDEDYSGANSSSDY